MLDLLQRIDFQRVAAALVGFVLLRVSVGGLYQMFTDAHWQDPWMIVLFPIVLMMLAILGGIGIAGGRLCFYALTNK